MWMERMDEIEHRRCQKEMKRKDDDFQVVSKEMKKKNRG
jgi:hypothetical protein